MKIDNEAKHTPTPWYTDGECVFSADCELHEVASCEVNHTCRDECEGEANAAHIVKCVNLHDELVEALKFIAGSNMTNPQDFKQVAREALKKAGAL